MAKVSDEEREIEIETLLDYFFLEIGTKLFSLRSLDQPTNLEDSTTAISAAVAATTTQTMAAVFESCSNTANLNGNELLYNNSQDFSKILQNLQKMGSYYSDDTLINVGADSNQQDKIDPNGKQQIIRNS